MRASLKAVQRPASLWKWCKIYCVFLQWKNGISLQFFNQKHCSHKQLLIVISLKEFFFTSVIDLLSPSISSSPATSSPPGLIKYQLQFIYSKVDYLTHFTSFQLYFQLKMYNCILCLPYKPPTLNKKVIGDLQFEECRP